LLGRYCDFDFAFLDEEYRIREFTLREYRLVLAILADAPAFADFGKKGFRIKRRACP